MAWLQTISIFIIFSILYVLYKLWFMPYMKLLFYKNQGISIEYVPIMGTFGKEMKNIQQTGDFFGTWKRVINNEPKPRALCTNLGTEADLILFDPKLLKEFMTHNERYIKHPTLANLFKEALGDALITGEGLMWMKHRKLILLLFHYEYLKEHIPNIVSVSDKMLENWKKKDLTQVSILKEIQGITGELIGQIFFGEKFGHYTIQGKPLPEFLTTLIQRLAVETLNPLYLILGKRVVEAGILPKHRKLMSDIREFRDFCMKIVKETMEDYEEKKMSGMSSGKVKTMLELFSEQRMAQPEENLSDEEIVDEFTNFLYAGTHSTSRVIAMATYYLLKNPECKEKLMKEIERNFDDLKSFDIGTLNKMDYMTATMKESLRMGTPLATLIDRVALEDHMLGDIKIKKGTIIVPGLIANNYCESYHEEPEKFKPERWIEKSKTLESTASNPYVFTPFSAGPRSCMGQQLAMIEMRVILSVFLKKFNYELSDKDYKLKMMKRFMYEPLNVIKYDLISK